MKDITKFLIFILYCTCIFFFPNNEFILYLFLINILVTFLLRVDIIRIMKSTLKVFPFIIFTFLINCLLDDYINAIYIGIKLIIVCNITFIYSNTISVTRNIKNYRNFVYSFKNIQNWYKRNRTFSFYFLIYTSNIKKRNVWSKRRL